MPYKDSGTCIIGGVDDVEAILDDQIVKVQAINASPFVAPFRERSSTHESSLMTLQVLPAFLFPWFALQIGTDLSVISMLCARILLPRSVMRLAAKDMLCYANRCTVACSSDVPVAEYNRARSLQ